MAGSQEDKAEAAGPLQAPKLAQRQFIPNSLNQSKLRGQPRCNWRENKLFFLMKMAESRCKRAFGMGGIAAAILGSKLPASIESLLQPVEPQVLRGLPFGPACITRSP